jgi:hypothetical protein
MNFIEQVFGFAPDGGTGVLELLLFAVPILVISLLWASRSVHKKGKARK